MTKFKVDNLIVKKENRKINFAHITHPEYVQSIKELGLLKGDGNLGEGIYCCDLGQHKSVTSLIELAPDFTGGDMLEEISIVIGEYSGELIECIDTTDSNFDYNIGFISLQEVSCVNIKEIKTDTLENILNFLYELTSEK